MMRNAARTTALTIDNRVWRDLTLLAANLRVEIAGKRAAGR